MTATRFPVSGARWNGWPPELDHHIGGIALQFADPDRLALGDLAHADLLAQRLGRADAGAHAAEDVLLKNRARGTGGIVGEDLADEERDVDAGGTGGDAGRVVAEVAAVSLDERLMTLERRVQVAEIGAIFFRLQTTGGNVGNPVGRHRYPLFRRPVGKVGAGIGL